MRAVSLLYAGVCCAFLAASQVVYVADPYNGDDSPRAKQLKANEAKLNVVLKLDRAQYFAGETAELTISVTNPTVSVLEIRDPFEELAQNGPVHGRCRSRVSRLFAAAERGLCAFDARGPVLDLMHKDPGKTGHPGAGWRYSSGEPRATDGPKYPDPPAVFLAAGNSLERRIRSHESFTADYRAILPGGVPGIPGEYRLAYTYGQHHQATVDFLVIDPRVVTYAIIVSPKTESRLNERYGETVQLQRRTFVLVFEGDGAYWVVASRGTGVIDSRLLIDKDGHVPVGAGRVFTPVVRVARSAIPIVSVQGAFDAAENLRITWTDQSGTTSTIQVDPDRNPRRNSGPLP